MNTAQAETAVSTSALVVGGIYLYRRLIETPSAPAGGKSATAPAPTPGGAGKAVPASLFTATGVKQLAGQGAPPPTSRFVVGWGFVYIVLSILAQQVPSMAAGLAFIAAVGAVLGNGEQVATDVAAQLAQKPQTTAATVAAHGAPGGSGVTVPISYIGGGGGMMPQVGLPQAGVSTLKMGSAG